MKRIFAMFLCIVVSPLFIWAANPKAVDLEFLPDESSAYVLFSDGVVQTSGYAISYGYPTCNNAVELMMTPTLKGYYVLTADGTIYSFGDAKTLTTPVQDNISYVDMKWDLNWDSPYFLRADGSVKTTNKSIFYGELLRPGMAVDMEICPDGKGYYILYKDGVIAFFGTAVNRGFMEGAGSSAVDLELVDNGYYIAYADGTIQAFGDAFPLPFSSPPADPVVDMALTPEGYRILLQNGDVKGFIRAEAQGTARWYTKVEPRFTPDIVISPTATPLPTAPYLVLDQSGFTLKMIGQINAEYDLPSLLDSGFTSLFGGGLFVVVSDKDLNMARKILFYSMPDSAGPDTTGTLFAEVAPERGSAEIRGLSYSQKGLAVFIQDGSQISIALIQGQFETTSVQGFSVY